MTPEPVAVVCPDLGASPARLGLWCVAPGDAVIEGERIAEVLIPGVCCDLPSPASGRLLRRLAAVRQPLNVGQVVALVQPDEDAA